MKDLMTLNAEHGPEIASDIVLLGEYVRQQIFCRTSGRVLDVDRAALLIIHTKERGHTRICLASVDIALESIQALINAGYNAKSWTIVTSKGQHSTTNPDYSKTTAEPHKT